MVSAKLAVIRADCIHKQPNTDAESIDEHIFLADVSHLLPKVLILLENPIPFLGQTGNNLLVQLRCFVPNIAVFAAMNDALFVGRKFPLPELI